MTAKSNSTGHRIMWDDQRFEWIYSDTKEIIKSRPCKHCGEYSSKVLVPIPPELSYTGRFRWDWKKIDSCITDIVQALNKDHVYTKSSCCGHGGNGEIILHDGRILKIKRKQE